MASGRDCRNVLYLAGSVKYTEHDISQNQSLNLRQLQHIKLQYSEI